ncbi:MAG: gluconate 2-dehydrogenase subunit 3 family protein [Gemmatimonadaceae bacterium]|nr:gluconate 2-dehydrogenase subunit 3 family protein [Gemmatimonadaceae bacterium]
MAAHENAGDFTPGMIDRREAILRVTALLGGVALVGGSALLTGCRDEDRAVTGALFTAEDIAFLDEVAETILPATSTPGAKAAKTGAFMALMVTDSYSPRDQAVFREGMRKLDEASRKAHTVSFMTATPRQRLALLEAVDREQKAESDARRDEKEERQRAEAALSDQRQEAAPGADVGAAAAITEDLPPHYFRMMKELALLGYFTSEIGYTQALRYEESPGRFDPCVPYRPGEKAWAPHA